MSATTTIRINALDRFRRAYAEVLDRQLVEVASALDALRERPEDALARRLALRLLQQMATSSVPWGFAAVGRSASSLKDLVRACLDGGTPAAAALRIEAPSHVEEMRRALGRRPETQERAERRLLHLVEDPASGPGTLGETLRRYGYDVRVFPSAAAGRNALDAARPVAVVVDLPVSGSDAGRGPALDALEELRPAGVPLLLFTDRADMASRIDAVRGGADGVFARPGDVGALLDRLERLTAWAVPDPYRVLVVDDDAVTGELNASTLRRAGIRAVRV
jgi:CheY-like chemotaxis protein